MSGPAHEKPLDCFRYRLSNLLPGTDIRVSDEEPQQQSIRSQWENTHRPSRTSRAIRPWIRLLGRMTEGGPHFKKIGGAGPLPVKEPIRVGCREG